MLDNQENATSTLPSVERIQQELARAKSKVRRSSVCVFIVLLLFPLLAIGD